MRAINRWFSYVLLVATLAALFALAACVPSQRHASAPMAVLVTTSTTFLAAGSSCMAPQMSRLTQAVSQPYPMCEWEGVCGSVLGDLLGCHCEAGGGGSGAGFLSPSIARRRAAGGGSSGAR